MVLGSSSGLDVTMVPVGSAGHLDHHGPNNSVVLEPLHGLRCGLRSQASALPLMATGALGICAGPVCSRVGDPDMALATAQAPLMPWPQSQCMLLRSVWLLGIRKAIGGGPDPGTLWPLEATQAIDINTDSDSGRTMDSDMVFGNSRDPSVIVALADTADYPDQHKTSGSVSPKHQHVPSGSPDSKYLLSI